jgi:prepilin-type N-terminal cleavage/methylation domain-containing protein
MPGRTTYVESHRPVRGGGFSLAELLAVMVIVAVVAATAAPAFTSMSSSTATMAGKQLLHDVSYARERAISTGVPTWVVFDTAAETWTLYDEDPSNPGRANRTLMIDPITGDTFVQAVDAAPYTNVVVVSAAFDANDEIGFDWLGRPFNEGETALAADGTVTLTGNVKVHVIRESGLAWLETP